MKQLLFTFSLLFTVTSFAQVPNYVPTNGLVGWWGFNGNANDASGNGNDGVVTDATLTADQFANPNSAYNFNYTGYSNGALDDMIYVPHNNDFNTPEITVSCWFKPTAWSFPGNPGSSAVFKRVETGYSNPPGEFWYITFGDDGTLYGGVVDDAQNGLNIASAPGAITLNQWHFVSLTYDGQNEYMYLNGTLIGSQAGTNALSTLGNSGLSFGVSFQANGYWRPFNGDIDNSGLWNRALSACEVAQLYSGQLSTIAVNAGADVEVCTGQPVTLSGTGASTYTWDNGVSDGVSFIPTSTTTYTVTGTDAAGCAGTDQVTITVNDLPTIVAGADQTVCSGTEVTLSGSGGASYVWDNSVTNGTPFTPLSTTTYTVTGTDINGCENTVQVTITVNDLPTIDAGMDQTICFGEPITLSANGATTYSWDNGVTDGIEFTPTASQTYTVTGTDANGCENTDDVLVTVNPLPDVTGVLDQTVSLSAGNTTQFTVPSGSTSYQWQTDLGVGFQNMSNAGQYSGTNTNVLTISNITTSNLNQQFRCVVTDGNCSDTSDVGILTVIDDLGLEELNQQISVYPNPTTSLLTIEGKTIQSKAYELLDLQGRVILNGTFKTNKETIDLKNLATGQYMLRVEGKEMKVVKE